ncbi:hypothetical protein SDRG_00762 [Saprolegnia diclina VS20]|uniref:Uncharacterized protein n=1 Tax=Saprolegnia diclina (strain VS20) TaxID=1156394 RepID=T0SFU4_SAPDV|nr:hypothetical protein SDRG_00762 [Saprolegnia diclina VS20]EQC41907.1 hypothetical protein SDRG_00762 [Saprolegnia diclina VS20]|eukprot:XP_008604476.1 hypothetical protein SDRG_00762 [Saprolegnia diclina VS20]
MRVVNGSINHSIAAHEAAMRKYRAAKTFAYSDKVSNDTLPELRVEGVDGILQWPLPPAQEQQLFARYTAVNGSISVPLEDTDTGYEDESPWQDYLYDQIVDTVDLGLGLTTTSLQVYFSHLCLDTKGSVDAFTPHYIDAESFDRTLFGTLVLVLPSPYNGGKITVSYDGASTLVQLKPLKKAMRFLATYRNTTMSSAPITSGYRAALVYHLVGMHLPLNDTSLLPVPRHETISAFATIATTPLPFFQRIARPIPYALSALTFDALTPADADFVGILVATQRYDVTLVQLKVDFLSSISDTGIINEVTACVPHPSCRIPKVVRERLLGNSASAFLRDRPIPPGDDEDSDGCPFTAILFWPKACRVGIVGVDVALPLLEKAILKPKANKLGLDSADDLVRGAIGLFRSMSRQHVLGKLPFKYVVMMTDALVDSNNVTMAELFLSEAVSVYGRLDHYAATYMIHLCLLEYGWPALQKAMLRLIQRWVIVSVGSIARLLANLAGATSDSKVTPLQQPFVCEFFKRCWHEVLVHQRTWLTWTIDENMLLMDWYLHDMAPLDANGHWLGQKLPPALVSVVDSFLYKHRHGVYTLLSLGKGTAWRLDVLPDLLLKAVALQPALVQKPYLNVITTDVDGHVLGDFFDTSSLQSGFSLLRVMDQIGRCDERLMEKVALLAGFKVVIAVSWLVTNQLTIAPSTRDSAIVFLDTCAVGLIENAKYEEAIPDVIVLLVMATVKAFNVIAPEKFPSFLMKWLPTMPPTRIANRLQLFPIIVQVAAMFPDRFRDTIVDLATQCRATFLGDADRTAPPGERSESEALAIVDAHFFKDRDLTSVATLDALLAPTPTTPPPKGGKSKSRKRRRRKDSNA